MMGAEKEVLVTLSGGAPWGFRLQGGAEQRKPLQVSKVRESPYIEGKGEPKGTWEESCGGGLWGRSGEAVKERSGVDSWAGKHDHVWWGV